MSTTKVVVTPAGSTTVNFTPEEQEAWDAKEVIAEAGILERRKEHTRQLRSEAYVLESDPLFIQEQAGEVEAGTWAEKRAEIKIRFPKPE